MVGLIHVCNGYTMLVKQFLDATLALPTTSPLLSLSSSPFCPFLSSPLILPPLPLLQNTREKLSSCEADLLTLIDAPHPLRVSLLPPDQQQQEGGAQSIPV